MKIILGSYLIEGNEIKIKMNDGGVHFNGHDLQSTSNYLK